MKFKKILAAILVLTILTCTLPFNMVTVSATSYWVGSSSYGWYANNTTALNEIKSVMANQSNSYIIQRFEKILSEYPLSGYFNSYKTQGCIWHCGSCGTRTSGCIDRFYDDETNTTISLNGWQCYGYARYCYYRFFSTFDSKTITLSSGFTSSNLNNIISSEIIGSHFRAQGHSMVFLAYDNSYLYFIDANSGYNSATGCASGKCSNNSKHYSTECKINLRKFSYSEFVSRYSSSGMIIYAPQSVPIDSVSVINYENQNTIEQTDAILWGKVDKPSSYPVTQIGIQVRKSDSSYANGWSKYEAPSWNYVGETNVYPYYDLNTELSLTLSPGTDYYYKIYAKVNGTEYWSTETKFTTSGGHTHNYTISGYEAAHPHKYYQKCNCGYYYYTGETATIDSCSICNALEKPIITIAKEEYHILSDIEISWTKIDRATHYKLCILQKESDKDNSTTVLEEDYITNNSYIVQNLFGELPIGEYCVYIYAYDNQNYNDKLNDWNNQKSDPVYFKIYTTVNYYDWNFDYDTFKDSYIKDSDTSYAEKNVINSKKVYNTDELLTNIDYERIGYKFTGWDVQFSPFETFGDITTLIYGIQAQYEPLLYSKGECLYGDTNFDGKTNVLDLIRLKRILIGDSENHISADLDADDKINAIDISMLKRLLLGREASKNIYFDANGGTVDETQRLVISGQKLGELPIPSRTGYDFTGWYTSDGTLLTSDTVMTTDSDITAIAKWSVKSYTYNIVYKSSNGTSLGTATAKYNFGTTNTISPKSFTGYTTPSSQSIKWDSTTAKTITFVYVPTSVSASQNLSSGVWGISGSTNYLTYSVKAEYQKRTANSVQVRLVWTNTLKANYKYGYTQGFKATIGGVDTGIVTIASSSLWSSSATYDRTATAYSEWKTISVGTSQSSISISAIPGRVLASGDIYDIDESFTSSITIPAY